MSKEAIVRQIKQQGRKVVLATLLVGTGAGITGCNEATLPTYSSTPNALATQVPPPGSGSVPSGLPAFPTTADNAAALFGGDASNWEHLDGNGWHAKVGSRREITPHGYLMEGYYNTPDGTTICGTSGDQQQLQGATIWDETATASNEASLAKKMSQPPGGSCIVFPSADYNN